MNRGVQQEKGQARLRSSLASSIKVRALLVGGYVPAADTVQDADEVHDIDAERVSDTKETLKTLATSLRDAFLAVGQNNNGSLDLAEAQAAVSSVTFDQFITLDFNNDKCSSTQMTVACIRALNPRHRRPHPQGSTRKALISKSSSSSPCSALIFYSRSCSIDSGSIQNRRWDVPYPIGHPQSLG